MSVEPRFSESGSPSDPARYVYFPLFLKNMTEENWAAASKTFLWLSSLLASRAVHLSDFFGVNGPSGTTGEHKTPTTFRSRSQLRLVPNDPDAYVENIFRSSFKKMGGPIKAPLDDYFSSLREGKMGSFVRAATMIAELISAIPARTLSSSVVVNLFPNRPSPQ